MWLKISLLIVQICEDFKTFQILKILILRIILRKLQNSKKNSKNKNFSEYGPWNGVVNIDLARLKC